MIGNAICWLSELTFKARTRNHSVTQTCQVFTFYLRTVQLMISKLNPYSSLNHIHNQLLNFHVQHFDLNEILLLTTERKTRSRPSSSTSRRRQKQPENKLLSYSLSVMGERPAAPTAAAAASVDVAAPLEGDWTLYRPQEPGNSPIYIAASPGQSAKSNMIIYLYTYIQEVGVNSFKLLKKQEGNNGPIYQRATLCSNLYTALFTRVAFFPSPQASNHDRIVHFIDHSPKISDGDFKGEAVIGGTKSRPPPRGQTPPRHRRPSEAAAATASRWRPRPAVVSSYDPFNQHVASAEAGPFGSSSRSYFSQRPGEGVEDKPRSGSFYFPL